MISRSELRLALLSPALLAPLSGACANACPPAGAAAADAPAVPVAPAAAPPPAPAAPPPSAPPAPTEAADPHLVAFSRAICFAYYLEEKGWDAESARHIAGGQVELGTRSAEAYEALANHVRAFEPPLGSKHRIDPHLSRCFQIEDDADWQRLVRAP